MARIAAAGMFEECADDLNDFINTLEQYPHTVLAFALRAHLSALLQALVAHGQWTHAELTSFLNDMEHETLHPDDG